jgi:UDP-N-acetylglucosamine--N-acetylmuramyl-(pentapeptide) pyrophosphoryl-undecaprenol N-acetylglucosamine transferase
MRVCRPIVSEADAVVGMGGYVSGPAVAAALRSAIPVVLHEQNAIPGLANRWFARKAKTVALSFEAARDRFPQKVNTVVTGNPVREAVATLSRHRSELRAEGLEVLHLANERRTIAIFGGSQGASHVNDVAVAVCRLLRGRSDLQVVILSGRTHGVGVEAAVSALELQAGDLNVEVLGFLDRMELAYAVADIIVSRAGATSIAEITAAGLAAILVPYPHATANHQEANARILQHAGAATVVLDGGMTASVLADAVTGLTDDDARRREMAEASAQWGRPDAASALANVIVANASTTRTPSTGSDAT